MKIDDPDGLVTTHNITHHISSHPPPSFTISHPPYLILDTSRCHSPPLHTEPDPNDIDHSRTLSTTSLVSSKNATNGLFSCPYRIYLAVFFDYYKLAIKW
jgi:hypothetical protein